MSDRDERQSSGAVYVTLPAEIDAAVSRVAAANFSSRAQVVRQAVGEWLRQQGEIPALVAEVA